MPFNIQENVDKMVEVTGHLAENPHQHMIHPLDTHPIIDYFDLEGHEDQIVIYLKKPVNCAKTVKLKGKVIKAQGKSKRPGDDTAVVEYQIIVDSFECPDGFLPDTGGIDDLESI